MKKNRIMGLLNQLIDNIFRRGALAVLEISGAVLLIRSVIVPSFNWKAALVGICALSIASVIEYLIWRESLQLRREVDGHIERPGL
ncbi:MAG: hypothetical protein K8R53_05575 [Bacteroidales bacterium]|nr:hypothetical protein [Bacteroidales bacterium]